jgi:hypothetical protein
VEFLESIEQLGFVRLLKASFYAYPIVSALHIVAIGALLTSVYLMDLRILGALATVPAVPFVKLLRRVALLAFPVAAITGLTMFAVRATEYVAIPVFLVKMCLIVLAGLNFALFLTFARGGHSDAKFTTGERITAGLSAILWTGVLLCGRFIGFV